MTTSTYDVTPSGHVVSVTNTAGLPARRPGPSHPGRPHLLGRVGADGVERNDLGYRIWADADRPETTHWADVMPVPNATVLYGPRPRYGYPT